MAHQFHLQNFEVGDVLMLQLSIELNFFDLEETIDN